MIELLVMIQLIILLIVLGIVWFFLRPYIAPPFDKIVMVLVLLAVCLWLLEFAGILRMPAWR